MAIATPEQAEQYRRFLASNPQAQALIQQFNETQGRAFFDPGGFAANRGGSTPQATLMRQLNAIAEQAGVAVPHDWIYDPRTGEMRQKSFFQRNADWILPAGIIGGGLAAGQIGAGGAASGAGSGTGGGATAMPTAGAITSEGMSAAMPGSMATVNSSGVGIGGAGMAGSNGGVLGSLKNWRTWADAAGDIGPVLSGASAGMAEGRRADAALNNDAIARNNQAGLDAARYNRDLPSVRASQTARGEVLNTMQNAPLTGDARIDKFSGGGLRPSAFGPQSRAAGAELSRQALGALMNPETDRFTPERIKPTSGGTVENIMGGVGIGADIFSLLRKYGGRR